MNLNEKVKPFASALLQDRLDGILRDELDVLKLAQKFQPAEGFTNAEWNNVSDFIVLLRDADNIPAAQILADKHGLTLKY